MQLPTAHPNVQATASRKGEKSVTKALPRASEGAGHKVVVA